MLCISYHFVDFFPVYCNMFAVKWVKWDFFFLIVNVLVELECLESSATSLIVWTENFITWFSMSKSNFVLPWDLERKVNKCWYFLFWPQGAAISCELPVPSASVYNFFLPQSCTGHFPNILNVKKCSKIHKT